MIKIILFDIDGVLIRLPHYYRTELEKNGYKNAGESLDSFFTGKDNHKCLKGKADANKLILPYLQKFGWRETARDYFNQQFYFESKYLDIELMSLITKLRKQNIICCLSTDQEKNRAKYLLNNMDFKNKFDAHYISCYIGYRKCHEQFWTYVLDDIKKKYPKIKNNEIVFFDDIQNNINVATKTGIQAFLFTDLAQFKKDLVQLKIHQ